MLALVTIFAVYYCIFAFSSVRFHMNAAGRPGVFGSIARFHLRYLRSFDPNQRNSDGDPLLHVALYNVFDAFPNDDLDDAKLALAGTLLACGANVDSVDAEGRTVLMKAVLDYNDKKALTLLSLGASPTAHGAGEHANDTPLSLFRGQVLRDSEAFPKLLRCDPTLLPPDEYWKMVLLRFATDVTELDPNQCVPLSDQQIEVMVRKHGHQLERAKLSRAMSLQAPVRRSSRI